LLESGIEPVERIRRLVDDILYAAYVHETMWQHEPQVPDNGDILQKVAAKAAQRGLDYTGPTHTGVRGSPARLGERRPSNHALLGLVLDDRTAADFFYPAASAVTYSSLHGFDDPNRRAHQQFFSAGGVPD
jgi:hypothetical protein